MTLQDKIYVAGHTGLVGSALLKRLKQDGYRNIVTATHEELDLCCQSKVRAFFEETKPQYVFMCAAKVGGIQANDNFMADFAMENAQITCNVLSAAHETSVNKLLYMGSSCIYPRESIQPIKEEYLLSGLPEPTNEGFALAKLLGVRMCVYYQRQYGDKFISCIPANAYGPFDHFNPQFGHVVPSLIRRFIEAKEQNLPFVEIWGSGKARREFLYIDDLADSLVFLMNNSDESIVNIGTGKETSISELAETIKKLTGYSGAIKFDISRPDGMPCRRLDTNKADKLGWKAITHLNKGLENTISWFLNNRQEAEK